jgi:drug/metabolite transporter (DMT)-like permease
LTETYPRSKVLAAFAAVYIVWGSTYLAIRFAVESFPPLLMAGSRFLLSGAMLYAFTRMRGSAQPTRREWRDSLISGALMLCGGNAGVAWAEQHVASGLAALIVAVVPLWMVLIEALRPGGARPTFRVILGVIVGLAGLVVLVGPSTLAGHGPIDSAAVMVLMTSAFLWAAGSVFNKHSARPPSAALATGMQMLTGSVVMLILGVATGETRGFDPRAITTASWLGWLYLVTFGSLIGFTAYVYLLKAVSPAKAATYAYVNPVVAVLLGWAILGEPVSARTILAAGIILGGVAMISLRRG